MEIEILSSGKVKVKYDTDGFTKEQGSWKIEGDKITVTFEDKAAPGTIIVYVMIRTDIGWTSETGTDVMSEPIRSHVTKEEASVQGEWSFNFGTTTGGRVRFTKDKTVQWQPTGTDVWGPEEGYWKITTQGKIKTFF